jgi:hypothetical protein
VKIEKTSAFGTRYNMYRLTGSAFAYNPDLREWEVFETDADGSIQDLHGRYQSRADAFAAADALSQQA